MVVGNVAQANLEFIQKLNHTSIGLKVIQNLKKFTEIMKESGMKQKDIDARMTEEDKELLAEEKYM